MTRTEAAAIALCLGLAGCGNHDGPAEKRFRDFASMCTSAGGLPSWTGANGYLCNPKTSADGRTVMGCKEAK